MSTRTLLNLGLALLIAALVLVAVYQPGLEPEALPQPIMTGIDPQGVSEITITRTARDPVRLSRHDGRWYLDGEAQRLPAAEFQVRALLRLLQATSNVTYAAGDVDLAALGLQPPQATLAVDGTEIRFGTTDALQDRRYVQLGKQIYLIEDQYQHLLGAEAWSFVERRLLPQGSTISGLELPEYTLQYSDTGGWRIEPDPGDISADDLQQWIVNWENATALHVSAGEDEETGEPVRIHLRGVEMPLEFRLISRSPDLVLARPEWGIRYHLATSLADSLFSPPEPKPEAGSDTEPAAAPQQDATPAAD
jgi:hypothetical protein